MGHFPIGWPPMDPAAAAALTGTLPLPSQALAANGAAYCVDPALYAFVPPHMMHPAPAIEAEAARRRQEEENAAIRLVHLLVTCAGAIQAGDYSAAHGNLTEAHGILAAITTAMGIGRVAEHFAAALSQRLFPATPHAAPPTKPPAAPAELYHHFYEATPYIKFAHSTANQAILEAFEGCGRVHVVDFALMQGLQWPALIHALAKREGGPPFLRITGIGPQPTGPRDELHEVGLRLAELARSLDVPFAFRGVAADQLDGVRPWMLNLVPGEAIAVNSILQLHRILVDPDADPTVTAPIDILLNWVTALQPRVFTVVEQEADHNKPSLLERFTNALFHYAAMFDSMEAVGSSNALAEAYLRAEIFDIVCGEGSARAERHELLVPWRERLARAGLTQLPFGPNALRQVTTQLIRMTSFSGAGFGVLECAGSLALAWHDRPLYAATAWRATGGDAAGAVTNIEGCANGNSRNGSSESNSSGNLATAQGAAKGIIMQ
ncbi:protein SLENDER RICE1-LIKE 2-like [Phragmites australis]|uniref:protein SLENDER RICE1-LIKE 2-like n=1 Tax=Phragmites australis TaxID=29695 RepID=UPI002D7767A4|nr:protein SLENDER RICE1-LIKE 2-like [Phragmites australis]